MTEKGYTEEEILQDFKDNIKLDWVQKQVEYYWIRLYTKEEYDIEPGTIIEMAHLPTGETLDLMFTNYDKKAKTVVQSDDLEEFETEEDKKVLCLLVNMSDIYENENVEYIRSLFRKSKYYEERLLKRKDLVFGTEHKNFIAEYTEENKQEQKEGIVIDYYDAMF